MLSKPFMVKESHLGRDTNNVMEHDISLITTLVAAFGVALILGLIAEWLKVPALVGYLLAGIIIGPKTPGFVADVHLASQLSEIGIMLLMFGVGLHFSLRDLLVVKRIAIPGALVQMGLTTIFGAAMALIWGWNYTSAFVFGLSLSVASTVVLLKMVEAKGLLSSMNGRIAVGWLVVEDLATILVLVLLPSFAEIIREVDEGSVPQFASLWWAIGKTLLEVSAFVVLMMIVGRRILPWILWKVAQIGSRELFTLLIIAAAIGIAYGAAYLFHVSFALGAFFAGAIMRESEFSHRAAEESLPLRDAFSVLFFVSVGMLFEPMILLEQPLHVLGILAIIILGKFVVSFFLVLAFRYPLNTALTVSVSLAQIGEFSFILSGLALSLRLLPAEGVNLMLAGALLSIALNPLLFALIEPIRRVILARSAVARRLEQRDDPYAELPLSTANEFLQGQVVIVGYGRVGRRIAAELNLRMIPYLVVEQNRELVEDLREEGKAAISGDATEPAVLIQAHIADAAMLVVATPDPIGVREMANIARTLNPKIEILLRTHSGEESLLLQEEQIGTVFYGEEELAKSMVNHVIGRFKPQS